MFHPGIAPSGTLLGLLQRGRGDGTLHALAARRSEALDALEQCVISDPRRDWRVESRSLYYARLYMELEAGVAGIEQHLFDGADTTDTDEQRTGLALSVLGALAGYGRRDARDLLRRYVATGSNWGWALDELALRDDEAGLRSLAPAVLARFPRTTDGEAALQAAVGDAFEPRPWRLWAKVHERVARASEAASFRRWQRQLSPTGPTPGWSVAEVLAWAQEGLDRYPVEHRDAPASRCLAAVAGPGDRPELLATARRGPLAARAAALRHLANCQDPAALDLIELAASDPSPQVSDAALCVVPRLRGRVAVDRARAWATRADQLGMAAAKLLAAEGDRRDAARVLDALRQCVQRHGADSAGLCELIEGAGRFSLGCAAPLLRHIYRETPSSHVRGVAAGALAATDPSFPAGLAVECLWDCEETTRELAAHHAATGDVRVLARLRRLAADPAEDAEVQTAVRGRLET